MSTDQPLIAIIVVNYNTQEETVDCLRSLLKINHDNFSYQIIVVDNGSEQELKLPAAIKSDQLELIRTEANIGFTGGNNLGISHAVKEYNPDYFLLLNSDTTVDPDFLDELYLSIQGDDRGISASKIYFEKGFEFHDDYQQSELGRVIWYGGGVIDWNNLMAYHMCVDEVDRGQCQHRIESRFCYWLQHAHKKRND